MRTPESLLTYWLSAGDDCETRMPDAHTYGGCVRSVARPNLAALLGCEDKSNRWADRYSQLHYMLVGTRLSKFMAIG